MSYITYDDVIARYPALSKIAETPSQVNSSFIHYAEQELNGRLASKFTVPFPAAHPTIQDLAIDLTYYRAILTREKDVAEKLHKHIIDRIEDIKEGREYIMTGSSTVLYAQGGGSDIWSTTMDHHPVHSMLDAESAFTMISSERLYAEEDERS